MLSPAPMIQDRLLLAQLTSELMQTNITLLTAFRHLANPGNIDANPLLSVRCTNPLLTLSIKVNRNFSEVETEDQREMSDTAHPHILLLANEGDDEICIAS